MTALGISEHGNLFEWLHKKEEIEKAGLKYLHCVEAYLTEDDDNSYSIDNGEKVWNKTKDNYHCILIAKNYDGFKEINKIMSKAYCRSDEHFYYMPRITLDELFDTSDNIVVTSACLGGAFNKGVDSAKEKMLSFFIKNKHRCYLEIQHHNCEDQIRYNQFLLKLHTIYDIPLIVGTDTHALNEDHLFVRSVIQAAKNVHFEDEDSWDLVFKTPQELINAYETQNSIPMEYVLEGMKNTIRMSDSVESFEIDRNPKYPKLYNDSEAVFKKKVNDGFLKRGIANRPDKEKYINRIHSEYETYVHNGAIDFMLLEEDYKSEMRKHGVRYGYSRGSVSGSIIAYLLGITEMDSVKYDLNFERFMNKERVSLPDIDSDWFTDDRDTVRQYLYNKAGLYCCEIVTYNTIALKGAIKEICRGLHHINVRRMDVPPELKEKIKAWEKESKANKNDSMPKDLEYQFRKVYEKGAIYKDVPYDYLTYSNKIIDIAEVDMDKAEKMYPFIFKLVKIAMGVVISVGNHPSACVVSPYPVDEEFGTFTSKTNKYPISVINMKEIDSLNYVKLDILSLDNIGLIYKTCDAVGIPFLTPDNTPPDDINVWKSIKDDTTLIFQWESDSATAYLRQLFSNETIEKIREKNPDFSYMDLLSIGNGAIRPAGESYRNKLAKGEYRLYGNEYLDEFMKPTLGYMVYQCQIIEFLHKFCGFTMGEADIVRRHFAKKTGTEDDIPIIRDGGYILENGKRINNHYIKGFVQTMKDNYGQSEDESNEMIGSFLQVIIDASDYLFSRNHADPYSWIGYICGYLRYYYPIEFLTVALNIFQSDNTKTLAIIDYTKRRGIKISQIKFRHSVAEYSFDKENNVIFKGIESIKFMNKIVAEELFSLRDKTYISFADLLFDIADFTSLDSRQLKILIELDFFSEFGDANYLMAQYVFFEKFHGKKQIKKDVLPKYNLTVDDVAPFAEKETEKMFTKVNMRKFVVNAAKNVQYEKRTFKEMIDAQLNHLGYIDTVSEEYKGIVVVLDVNTKFAPRLSVYSLRTGRIFDCKINRKVFNKDKLCKGDIVKIMAKDNRNKQRRTDDGKFEPIPGVYDLWLTRYKKIQKI